MASSNRITRVLVAALLLAGPTALVLAVEALSPWYQLMFNRTPSLPGFIFLLEGEQPPACGDYAIFVLPEDGRRHSGIRLLKKVAGCPGDVVTVNERREVFINGWFAGQAKYQDSAGNPLSMLQGGVIPAGHYYMWAPHSDSYDSRYSGVGLVPAEWIVGRAQRLW